jgi:predicted dehydrogenase
MPQPVNIAILSTAHIHTRGFLENLRDADDGRAALVIWDADVDRGSRYATEFGTRFEPDLETVLQNPEVHGFLILAENTAHLELLERTLPLGKAVFCEKPLVTNAADLARVQALKAQHGTVLFAGYFQPFNSAMQGVIAALQSGELGRITHARFRMAHDAAYGRWFDHSDLRWFTQPHLSGGGALMDLGTHVVHLLATLFGDVTRVWATVDNKSGAYPDVDDFGIAHLEFASGVLGTLEANWVHRGPDGLEVHGSQGSIWLEPGVGYVLGRSGQEPRPIPALVSRPNRVDRLVAIIRGELDAQELQRDLEASLTAVRVIEAAYRSSRTGSWISTS